MKMRKQSLITPVILSALLPTLLLSGCGGGDDDSASSGSTGPVVEQAPVSARDGFRVVAPDELGYVDLSSLIESGSAGATVTDIYLESIQGSGQCGQVLTSAEADSNDGNIILGQGFNVTVEGAAICEYGYEVESVALAGQSKTRAKAKVMVASSAGDAVVLPPISIAMAINDPIEVTDIETALGTDFPAGYTLSEGFSVLGDGDVTVDAPAFSISYTATAEGISRVVYALEGDIGGVPDIKMGTLDYAVSDSLNNAPTAANFSYDSEVAINISVDIHVTDYISDMLDDGDELQLIEVKSYTANVEAKDNNVLSNKVFTFEAAEWGKHYVNYTVSDHRGGFATGIVNVNVFDPELVAKWADIENGLNLFIAPQTKIEIDNDRVTYQGFVTETNYMPALQIPTFTYEGAQEYCKSRGRLPTPDEMEALYLSKSPYNNWLWPADKSYLTQDGVVSGLYSLTDGTASPLDTTLNYVTCIDSGGLTISSEKGTVVADGNDSEIMNISFVRANSGPVQDQILNIRLDGFSGGTAIASESTVTTDINGEASFSITNIKYGITDAIVEYTNQFHDVVTVSDSVDFIGDILTARVYSLTEVRGGAAPDGIARNILSAQLLDANDNPVKGAWIKTSFDSVTTAHSEDLSTLITGDDGVIEFGLTNLLPPDRGEETVEVTVTFSSLLNGLSSQKLMVDFDGIAVCGGAINDSDLTNAGGKCLKVISKNGLLYASSPSLAVLDKLEYVEAAGNVNVNSGKTYQGTQIEIGESFGLFDQLIIGNNSAEDSYDAHGVNGQYERWCQTLNDISFNGIINWRTVTKDELTDLYPDTTSYDAFYDTYGWPRTSSYFSNVRARASISGSSIYGFYRVGLRGAPTGSNMGESSEGHYASCASD